MKKFWWLIALGSLVAVFFFCNFFGILRWYHIPTGSNEPTINPGDWILASRLVAPKRSDFICYHQAESRDWPAGTWLMRLCGLPGDTLQLVDGVCFVNGQNADTQLNLKMEYAVASGELKKLGAGYFKDPYDRPRLFDNNSDSVYALIGKSAFRKYSIGGRLVIDNDTLDDFKRLFGHSWTPDNFGPVIVPPGHYFVLGDNRHGAADSRFTGFIDQQDFRGTVLKIY